MRTDVDKLRSFLKQMTSIVETYGNKGVLSDIDNDITATESSTSILFCGEFKRGKSSLINAIVGSDICPTDIGIATSVVTVIKYGEVRKAVRHYGNLLENADSLKSEEIEWDDIERYTVGDVLEIDNTILVELSYPSEFLKDGLTIIDTPGIGGLDPRHAVLTHMAMPKADAIIFVTAAGEPLTQSEKDFYEEKVLPCGKPNLVLVNKSDILTNDILEMHLKKTRLELSKFGEIEVLPVSAKYWEMYSKFEDKDFMIRSNMDSVLAGINSRVELYRKGRYRQFRDIMVDELGHVSASIASEIEQLKKDSKDKSDSIAELQKQQAALSKLRMDLNNPSSQIRLQINSIFEDARNDVQNLISHEGTILTSTEFDSLLEDEQGLDDEGKWFVAQINDRLHKLSRKVDKRIEKAFRKISETIEKKMNLVMNSGNFSVSDEIKSVNMVNSQMVFSLAGKVMTGTMIGGVATTAVGFLLNPVVGIVAGFATAAALIWRQVSRETQQQKRLSLRQQVLPKVNLAITDMRNQASTRFSKFHQNLLMTLQTMMEETEEKIKVLQISIQESRLSEQKGKEKILELEQKIKFCETMTTQMKLLYSTPFSNAK